MTAQTITTYFDPDDPENCILHISFNPKNPEDCRRAIFQMKSIVYACLPPATARELMSEAVISRTHLGTLKNARLMALYVLAKKRRISVGRFAIAFANKQRDLPPADRLGPRGSTDPATIAKQIRRQEKLAAKNPAYRGLIDSMVTALQRGISLAMGKMELLTRLAVWKIEQCEQAA